MLCKRPVVVIHVIMGIVNVVLFADICIFWFLEEGVEGLFMEKFKARM